MIIRDELVVEARQMLEQSSNRYHLMGAWVGLVLNPVFSITDYFNLPAQWKLMLGIRIVVSLITLSVVLLRGRLRINSFVLLSVPFLLISLQNAFVYRFISDADLLGQNLNYMAMFIGAAMFVQWRWKYSVVILLLSAFATAVFLFPNAAINVSSFLVNGGLLLGATGIFAGVLIQTRYRLTMRTIIAQLELKESKLQVEEQAEEIKRMNENLEDMIQDRTRELENKNGVLEEYAFINSHKLRGPVATILGLLNLFDYLELKKKEDQALISHMRTATENLDKVVKDITKAIEKGDQKIS